MNNLDRFKKNLKNEQIEVALTSKPLNIFYLSGYKTTELSQKVGTFNDPHGFLVVYSSPKKRTRFIVDPRYSNIEISSDIEIIVNDDRTKPYLDSVLDIILSNENIRTFGIEKFGLNYFDGSKLTRKLSSKKIRTKSIDKILLEQRVSKSDDEIKKHKEAQKITDKVFGQLVNFIKPGMSELEISSFIEQEIKSRGAVLAFDSIVASGPNSAIPHHHSSNRKVKKNDIILLDFGAKYKEYCSDMSRTIFIGTPSKEMIKDYNLVLKNLNSSIEFLKKNKKISDLVDFSSKNLKHEHAYFNYHSLGHGVGIDIHEAPSLHPKSKDKFKSNSIITIEPGIYIPGKYGIRIEDMVLIGNKVDNLTSSSKELIILH